MNRTPSIRSRVGPAVTTIRRPERGESFEMESSVLSSSVAISSGSAIRPRPHSPEASSPLSGVNTWHPWAARVATLRCTEADRNIWPSIAGKISTGRFGRSVMKHAVSMSSHSPRRQLCHCIGRRRRNHQRIGPLAQRNMPGKNQPPACSLQGTYSEAPAPPTP